MIFKAVSAKCSLLEIPFVVLLSTIFRKNGSWSLIPNSTLPFHTILEQLCKYFQLPWKSALVNASLCKSVQECRNHSSFEENKSVNLILERYHRYMLLTLLTITEFTQLNNFSVYVPIWAPSMLVSNWRSEKWSNQKMDTTFTKSVFHN